MARPRQGSSWQLEPLNHAWKSRLALGDELRLEQEVEELPRRAAAVDEAEDALYGEGKRDDELPGELAVSDHCWFPWGPPDADAPPLNCVGLSPV